MSSSHLRRGTDGNALASPTLLQNQEGILRMTLKFSAAKGLFFQGLGYSVWLQHDLASVWGPLRDSQSSIPSARPRNNDCAVA